MEFVGANSFARNFLNVRMNSHPHLLLFLGSGLGYYLDAPATVAKLRVSIPFHSGLGYYQLFLAITTYSCSLNPFSFRAGVLPNAFTRLLLQVLESQSLFIQGWGTTIKEADRIYKERSQSLFIQGWGTTVWCHFLLCLQNVEIVIRGFLAS